MKTRTWAVAVVVGLAALLLAVTPLAVWPGASASYDGAQRVAAVAAPSPADPAPGCAVDGELEVCFSSPSRGRADARVIDRMRLLFRSAGEGDALRIAMFRWETGSVAEALLAAQARGARIELVTDDDVRSHRVGRRLLDRVERGDPTRRNVVVCRGACLPWRGTGRPPGGQDVNHLKLILADVDGVQSVISTSSNIVGLQFHQWNSLVKITDPGLYAFELAHFQRLRLQSLRGWSDADKVHNGSPTAYVYPNRSDLVVNVLRRVRCTPGMRRVDVLVAVIQRRDVRQALGRLHRAGCRVRVVVDREPVEQWLQAPVAGPGGFDLPDSRVRTLSVHDKVYAIHARIGGREAFVVLTGTSDTTCGGLLYNDEVMLRLSGRWVFQRYAAHVGKAYRAARQTPAAEDAPDQAACR